MIAQLTSLGCPGHGLGRALLIPSCSWRSVSLQKRVSVGARGQQILLTTVRCRSWLWRRCTHGRSLELKDPLHCRIWALGQSSYMHYRSKMLGKLLCYKALAKPHGLRYPCLKGNTCSAGTWHTIGPVYCRSPASKQTGTRRKILSSSNVFQRPLMTKFNMVPVGREKKTYKGPIIIFFSEQAVKGELKLH